MPTSRKEALAPLLEKLKGIESLKELVILGDTGFFDTRAQGNGGDQDGQDDQELDSGRSMDFVDETVNWIAERAAIRKRESREAHALAQAHAKEKRHLLLWFVRRICIALSVVEAMFGQSVGISVLSVGIIGTIGRDARKEFLLVNLRSRVDGGD